MGDGATQAINNWIRMGMPDQTPRKRRIPIGCPNCGKKCYGHAALMQHQNAKHGTKHTMLEIDVARDKEIYG